MNDGATESSDGRTTPAGRQQETTSQVFIVRLWEEATPGGGEWHGRVQHVLRGESRSFAGLEMLILHMQSMLRPPAKPGKNVSPTEPSQD
jgi:hypothetical protein